MSRRQCRLGRDAARRPAGARRDAQAARPEARDTGFLSRQRSAGKPQLREIGSRLVRATAAHELIPVGDLPPAARGRLGRLIELGECSHVLVPLRKGATAKAVGSGPVDLLRALSTPVPLDRLDGLLPAGEVETVVATLVLDGVLELEGDDGFVSGPAAHAELVERSAELGHDRLAELTLSALRYGTLLGREPLGVANRLYAFNRAPLTVHRRERLSSEAAVSRALGLSRRGRLQRLLAQRRWEEVEPSPRYAAWRMFRRVSPARRRLGFKLYVSPRLESLGATLGGVLDVLSSSEAGAFKIGRELTDLVRPDKLVAYFATRHQLDAAAKAVAGVLGGADVQGVPFTAAADERGITSWGRDPPRGFRQTPWERPSWRLWLVDRLAVSLVSALDAAEGVDAITFALDRLALGGVDVSTWMPDAAIWGNGR